ncbi:hypothetical protein F5Y10DRAFT_239365 [Nemania abortiva]|nr:hypothetical protein F5Y10DRAFT_239365 [Nemania abortiva]
MCDWISPGIRARPRDLKKTQDSSALLFQHVTVFSSICRKHFRRYIRPAVFRSLFRQSPCLSTSLCLGVFQLIHKITKQSSAHCHIVDALQSLRNSGTESTLLESFDSPPSYDEGICGNNCFRDTIAQNKARLPRIQHHIIDSVNQRRKYLPPQTLKIKHLVREVA